jgi:DNA-binding response OmpR family regulator
VDDDDSIREFIGMALEDAGFDVEMAEDGLRALEIARRRTPSVILLDMRMGGMDGRGFAAAYRAGPGDQAPILVLTAARDAAASAAEIRADAYLEKPFDLKELLDMVEDLCGTRRAARSQREGPKASGVT